MRSLFRNLFPAPRPDFKDSIDSASDKRNSLDPFELPSEGGIKGKAKLKYRDAIDRHWAENA